MDKNVRKRYGNLKIIWHSDKLRSLLKDEVSPPICIRIKPTNKCNHRCYYCSYHPEAKINLSENINLNDEIPREKMLEILDDLKEMGVKAVTYSGGGEPLIYPYITEILKKTIENGIDLSMITNGQCLKGINAKLLSKAKWVRISLDACRPETFSINRNVSQKLFFELVENIKEFAKKKDSQCELGINFVVSHVNKDEIFEAAKFFKELGVNHIKFTPRWVEDGWMEYHSPFKEHVIEQINKAKKEIIETDPKKRFGIYDTYENDFKMTGIKNREYTQCYIMQTVPVIGADSNVYFCHDKTYTKKGALGSIKDRSFKELWYSKEAKEKFKSLNPQVECKQHCTYDHRNLIIRDAIDCYGDNINFI